MATTAAHTHERPQSSDFGPAAGLSCRECGQGYELGARYVCEVCFGPLEIAYAWLTERPPSEGAERRDEAGRDRDNHGAVERKTIEAGPRSIWRYASLLPVPRDVTEQRNLHPGFTPLVRADNLARALGMRRVWIKDDSANPTHSFKDRVVAVALAAGRQLGFTTFACASTGNLANAVAAAAARAGMHSRVFVPSDLEAGKIVTTAVYGGALVAVDGTYDDVNRLCSEVAGEEPWGFVNINLRPYYAEGSKTLGFEIAEQLGWRLPEQVVVPIASGSQVVKIDKGFGELGKLGLLEESPYRIFGAQATGCAPVSAAWNAGDEVVRPVRPDTIAKSLAIGNPADGVYVLDVVRRTGGQVADVSDPEIVDAMRLLASTEGIFPETAGGVSLATLRKELTAGEIDPAAETVVLNTGDGLKTIDAVQETARPTVTIPPSLDAFREADLGG